MFDPELERFKSEIDIHGYAAAHGYVDDMKASWKAAWVMRHAETNDKIVVRKHKIGGHNLWLSNRTGRRGSIIDFVHYLKGDAGRMDIGAIRRELRSWIGEAPAAVPSYSAPAETLKDHEKDRVKVRKAYAKMRAAVEGHPYLAHRRALPQALLASERFAGRIRIDARGNAIFPHFDAAGLCGYEIKNVEFTGFASGGSKALWLSRKSPDDKRLVFCESAIDALSHAALFPDDHARYASTGGGLNDKQPEIIRAAIARMPQGSEIVAAMDADEPGRRYAETVRQALEVTGRADLRFVMQEPEGAKDWNDLLRAKPQPLLPFRPEEASPG
jgi:hypothetical protein